MGETRRRIARATFELHSTLGPAYTSISAIAERAGLQRATVYKHFPEERELHGACVEYGLGLDPPPDPGEWLHIDEPHRRLLQGLTELYSWYGRNRGLLANVSRDLPVVLPRFEGNPPAALVAFMQMPGILRDTLAEGWDAVRPTAFLAAVALAVDFQTWNTLVGQGLDDEQAAALIARWIECASVAGAPD